MTPDTLRDHGSGLFLADLAQHEVVCNVTRYSMLFPAKRPLISLFSISHFLPIRWLRNGAGTSPGPVKPTGAIVNTSSSKRRYTPEEDEKITRGYNDGLTWYEVASDMNRTAKAIRTRFRTNLAASLPKKSSARWNDVDDKLLVDCRGKGELFRAIATKLDRTFDSVRKRYNLLVPTALKDTARNRYRPSEDLALLRLRDKEHKTFREIGILLRRPRSSIQARYRSLSDLQVISGNDSSLFNAQYTPFEDAKILRMREREDASFREIADELGRTSRSVQGPTITI